MRLILRTASLTRSQVVSQTSEYTTKLAGLYHRAAMDQTYTAAASSTLKRRPSTGEGHVSPPRKKTKAVATASINGRYLVAGFSQYYISGL